MLDPDRIKHKGLKRFAESGDKKGLRPDWVKRTERVLSALMAATAPDELNLPGFHWHELGGDRRGTYATTISRNWRLTYRWDDHGPFDLDLEDYHG